MLGQLFGKGRRGEFHGMPHIHRFHEYGISHALVVCLFGCVRLAVFRLRLAALLELRSGEKAQRAVSGAVGKYRSCEAVSHFGGLLEAADRNYAVVCGFNIVHYRVEINVKQLFSLGFFKEHRVPVGIAECIIMRFVFGHKLVNQAALGIIGLFKALVGARDMYSDLTRGIAAEHRSGVYQRRACPVSCGGDCGAKTCHSASYDNEFIAFFFVAYQLFLLGSRVPVIVARYIFFYFYIISQLPVIVKRFCRFMLSAG